MQTKYSLLILIAFVLSACGPTFDKTKYGTAERDIPHRTMNELPQKMDDTTHPAAVRGPY